MAECTRWAVPCPPAVRIKPSDPPGDTLDRNVIQNAFLHRHKEICVRFISVQCQYSQEQRGNTEVAVENFVILLIPAISFILFIRLLAVPMRLLFRFAVHAVFGFISLWILNSIGIFTGIRFPVNLITILIAGVLGAPGIEVLALFAVLNTV